MATMKNATVFTSTVLEKASARGIYPNVMAEMLSLLKKRESRKIDVSKELSFIEKEFNDKLEKISAKLLAFEESVEKSSQKLLQMICKLGTAV